MTSGYRKTEVGVTTLRRFLMYFSPRHTEFSVRNSASGAGKDILSGSFLNYILHAHKYFYSWCGNVERWGWENPQGLISKESHPKPRGGRVAAKVTPGWGAGEHRGTEEGGIDVFTVCTGTCRPLPASEITSGWSGSPPEPLNFVILKAPFLRSRNFPLPVCQYPVTSSECCAEINRTGQSQICHHKQLLSRHSDDTALL